MTAHYRSLLFGAAVRSAQAAQGSPAAEGLDPDSPAIPDRLGEAEAGFIAARDSFYIGSAGAGGWPYLQHRGGPAGFVKVLDPDTLAFADFRGNRQYISLGNVADDDRVALFFMDYANRARLKLLGHMRAEPAEGALLEAVRDPSYRGRVERVMVIKVEAFDWNCSQHITPRYSLAEIEPVIARLQAHIAELEAALAACA